MAKKNIGRDLFESAEDSNLAEAVDDIKGDERLTFDNYDSDKDPNGARGHALADAVIRQCGGWDAFMRNNGGEERLVTLAEVLVVPGDMKNNLRAYWKSVEGVVFSRFGSLESGERIGVKEYNERFRRLKGIGFPVPSDWSTMSLKESRDAYNRIKEYVRKELIILGL